MCHTIRLHCKTQKSLVPGSNLASKTVLVLCFLWENSLVRLHPAWVTAVLGTGMVDDQMDDETLIIPSRPISSKAVINFAELHQIRDILYVPTDSYTTGTAALSRWGRLAMHTKYSCSPFPPLSLTLSLFVSHSAPLFIFSLLQCLVYILSLPYLSPSILPLQCLWVFICHTLLPLQLSSPPLILLSVLPQCC